MASDSGVTFDNRRSAEAAAAALAIITASNWCWHGDLAAEVRSIKDAAAADLEISHGYFLASSGHRHPATKPFLALLRLVSAVIVKGDGETYADGEYEDCYDAAGEEEPHDGPEVVGRAVLLVVLHGLSMVDMLRVVDECVAVARE